MQDAVVIVRGTDGREFGIGTNNCTPYALACMLDEVKSPGARPWNFSAGNFAAKLTFEALNLSHRTRLLTAREFNGDVGQSYTYLVEVQYNAQSQPYLNVMVYLGARGELPVFCGATGGFRKWAENDPVAA